MSSLPIGILGTGAHLPERVLSNEDLEKLVETSDQWIIERTGIRERRIASPEEDVATMGEAAARQALENAGIDWNELKYIIVGSNTANYMFPRLPSVSNMVWDWMISWLLSTSRQGAPDLITLFLWQRI